MEIVMVDAYCEQCGKKFRISSNIVQKFCNILCKENNEKGLKKKINPDAKREICTETIIIPDVEQPKQKNVMLTFYQTGLDIQTEESCYTKESGEQVTQLEKSCTEETKTFPEEHKMIKAVIGHTENGEQKKDMIEKSKVNVCEMKEEKPQNIEQKQIEKERKDEKGKDLQTPKHTKKNVELKEDLNMIEKKQEKKNKSTEKNTKNKSTHIKGNIMNKTENTFSTVLKKDDKKKTQSTASKKQSDSSKDKKLVGTNLLDESSKHLYDLMRGVKKEDISSIVKVAAELRQTMKTKLEYLKYLDG